jgi:integrase/recombinase XerD
MSNPRRILPFQPMSMTTAQLAAVSFLARYAGHTHELYSYQLPEIRRRLPVSHRRVLVMLW